MPFFVIKKGLVLLEWKYFPTPKILDPLLLPTRRPDGHHAFARASAPTQYVVPGYMRMGESVFPPT